MSLDSLVPVKVPFDAVQDFQALRPLDDEYTHKAKSYSEGQWFLVKREGEVQRVYLSLKLVDYNQYLFINILGQKMFSLDVLTFSDYLKCGSLTPLIQNGVCIQLYSLAVDKILQDFYERYDNQMKAKALSEEQAKQFRREEETKRFIQKETEKKLALKQIELDKKAELERKARAEVLAKQLAEQQRAELEKVKALADQKKREQLEIEAETSRIRKAKEDAEAARVYEMQRQAEAQRQAQLAKQNLSDDVIRQTRLALDTLILGAKIDFIAQNGQAVRAKLAVKFNATKRYVFIDHDGFTILDAVRNDVLDLVLQGKVILIDADQQFNDKLSSVIHSIQESQAEVS